MSEIYYLLAPKVTSEQTLKKGPASEVLPSVAEKATESVDSLLHGNQFALCTWICFKSAIEQEKKRLQQTMRSAEKIIGADMVTKSWVSLSKDVWDMCRPLTPGPQLIRTSPFKHACFVSCYLYLWTDLANLILILILKQQQSYLVSH